MTYEEFLNTEVGQYLKDARLVRMGEFSDLPTLFADVRYIYNQVAPKKVVRFWENYKNFTVELFRKNVCDYTHEEWYSIEECETSFLAMLASSLAPFYTVNRSIPGDDFVDTFKTVEEFEEVKHLYKDFIEENKEELAKELKLKFNIDI
jgi:hypothetical protein